MDKPDGRPGRAFRTAVILAVAGGVVLLIGLGASFSRPANVLDALVVPGMILLAAGVLKNVLAFYLGAVHLVRQKRVLPWWPFSALLILVAFYEGWVLTQR